MLFAYPHPPSAPHFNFTHWLPVLTHSARLESCFSSRLYFNIQIFAWLQVVRFGLWLKGRQSEIPEGAWRGTDILMGVWLWAHSPWAPGAGCCAALPYTSRTFTCYFLSCIWRAHPFPTTKTLKVVFFFLMFLCRISFNLTRVS